MPNTSFGSKGTVALVVTVAAAMAVTVVGLGAGQAQARGVAELAQQAGRIPVSVIGPTGAAVPGLTAGDFAVRVDGVEAEVLSVAPAQAPLSIIVIPSGFPRDWVPDVRELIRVVLEIARSDFPAARVGLMTHDGAASPVMRDAVTQARALEAEVSQYVGLVNTPLLDGLLVASAALSGEPADRRRMILAISVHGSLDVDGLAPGRITRAVRESRASLWVLDFLGQLPQGSAVGDVLAHVPAASGGQRLSSSLATMVFQARQIMATIKSQYIVTVHADGLSDTSSIRIGVRRDGVVVLAPHWQ